MIAGVIADSVGAGFLGGIVGGSGGGHKVTEAAAGLDTESKACCDGLEYRGKITDCQQVSGKKTAMPRGRKWAASALTDR